ncbi:glycosyltransferase family 2 protein [Parvularcula sp. ZS-1/3]|uniref:Glycosyltransferase family 2 protein n=1 Tax=Parvularcula mediterranea TaxID=2732508 RepID=A0A7Y3W4M6_9PROT|nr:glycosyltransferase family 2 protein [Parvularcula mediterranea]NNU15684.1 glycosyltransferase family 2 protein [Parvularcula mediterranea]
MTELPPVSAYIRTKNEARRIGEVVRAAKKAAREVIVVDSGSDDGTERIAEEAGAIVHHVPWRGNGGQKRAAEDLCTHDWLLDLDADEVIDDEMAASIRAFFEDGGEPSNPVYGLRQVHAVPFGKPWYGTDIIVKNKFYDRRQIRIPDHPAWDQLEYSKKTSPRLGGFMLHYMFSDIGDLAKKQERNMTRRAAGVKQKAKWVLALRIVFNLPIYFLKRYLGKALFRKGIYGFAFSMTIAYGRWLKDVKLYERHLAAEQEAKEAEASSKTEPQNA